MSDIEKINIYITDDIYSIIERDIKHFEIFKNDGSHLNRNKFLNLLISGYYETYTQKCNLFLELATSILKESGVKDSEAKYISVDLLEKVVPAFTHNTESGKKSINLSLKATNQNESIIKEILGSTSSPSTFFRQMIMSYCELPLYVRESIIFSHSYKTIIKAIKDKKIVCFTTTKSPKIIHEIMPYKVVSSNDGMFNYILCQEINGLTGKPAANTYRLSRIQSIHSTVKNISFNSETLRYLKKMESSNPRFAINNCTEKCVRLTEAGKRKFKLIYLDRPDPISIIDNIYYFDCSDNQLLQYFQKLGKDAEIIKPLELRKEMQKFYNDCASQYSINDNDDDFKPSSE